MNGIKPFEKSRKWLIVHGHFYQPPRENPWLDVIEKQPSASPYRDWNERIYAECYRPNGYSRLLDPHGMITGIYNNYSSMSFNFGPTLMEWLKKHHPVTASRIVEGDRISSANLKGHGNAIAQVFNHIIMPLASRRDQLTQIRWGKASFKRTFGRPPEGIWLSETAINMETVRCLIEEKIAFVILSPTQAEAFRKLDSDSEWISVKDRPLDTKRPYRLYERNSSGKKEEGYIDVFFFDEQLSREVSFGDLLHNASILGKRINDCYTPDSAEDEVVVIATDGETFGHHKPFGDMCLAYFFAKVAKELNIVPVNFGFYLASHQPIYEVMLKNEFGEGTAWSCSHGVGRWKRDCGCQTGGQKGWNQKWRAPMRHALDRLQEKIDETYVGICNRYGIDPWKTRDAYVNTFGSDGRKKIMLIRQPGKGDLLTEENQKKIRRLLEAQKYMLFAYTSCGWFFADISGIEAMQNLAYACRALQLGIDPHNLDKVLESFLDDLKEAKSNLNGDTGATLFRRHILPFFSHEPIIAFAAAIKYGIESTTRTKVDIYGYVCVIRLLKRQSGRPAILPPDKNSPAQGLFFVEVENKPHGERSRWLVVTEIEPPKEPSGLALPWNDRFEKDRIALQEIESNSQTGRYTLSDLFLSIRNDIADFYLEKIRKKTTPLFSKWTQSNEPDIKVLQSFYPSIPEYYRAPILFMFQQRWDALFSRLGIQGSEDDCVKEMAYLQKELDYYKMSIDTENSAAVCEKLLVEELEDLAVELNEKKCERIRYLLNIVDRFSLPVSKHRLEDIFFPILTGKVRSLYYEVINMAEKKESIYNEKMELLIKLLSFARRMNFSTEDFPLPEKQHLQAQND